MNQVERAAKKIPSSQIADGIQETATGIGTTVSEGAKYSGEKPKDAGRVPRLGGPPAPSHTEIQGYAQAVSYFDQTSRVGARRVHLDRTRGVRHDESPIAAG